MNVDEFGAAFGVPLPAVVLEIAHQFLLFGVNRNDRLLRCQEPHGLPIDVMKLSVAVNVLASFAGLAVGLQTVAHVAQKIADHRGANLVPSVRKLLRQVAQAAARPQQRLHGVAPCRRLDQAVEIGHKGGILHRLLLATAARLAGPSQWRRYLASNVGPTVINRRSRKSGNPRHQTDAAAPQRLRLQRSKTPSALFIQNRCHFSIALPCSPRLRRSNHAREASAGDAVL